MYLHNREEVSILLHNRHHTHRSFCHMSWTCNNLYCSLAYNYFHINLKDILNKFKEQIIDTPLSIITILHQHLIQVLQFEKRNFQLTRLLTLAFYNNSCSARVKVSFLLERYCDVIRFSLCLFFRQNTFCTAGFVISSRTTIVTGSVDMVTLFSIHTVSTVL